MGEKGSFPWNENSTDIGMALASTDKFRYQVNLYTECTERLCDLNQPVIPVFERLQIPSLYEFILTVRYLC